ncbi:DNA recombination and repair protein RecF [hydrothermal vent metagenome]|uniref:DNA replication and repair protein RecF n=1 Tax=hydrothermal vent metagenome TaxID=652676 RepID=A0A3B1B4I6_9ZZZZ
MSLNMLALQNFRNIEAADLNFSSTCNIFIGDNGAGKTNILESIYYLSLSRSFRTSQPKKLIQVQASHMQVVGRVTDRHGGSNAVLGIRKSVSDTQIRINGETVKQSSRLASYLPVQVIHPQGHELLEQGPKLRRQFLDWGVFHVEPSFLSLWHDYAHTLKQRNAALRQGQAARAIQLWDDRVIVEGEKITDLRRAYLDKLKPHINDYCLALLGLKVEVDYRAGWLNALDFADALKSSLELDQQYGYTRMGPHRADLIFKNENNRVQDYFSRGQQKLLVCALRLAQVKQLIEETKRDALILIDDLAAELDERHREKLIATAFETGAQVFMTSTQLALLKLTPMPEYKVFHVEHGHVTEMVQSSMQTEIIHESV